MAISATFSADFSDFQSAVTKAEVSLKSFEAGAGKVEKSLDKMSNSLSGTKMIQDATLMAEAVERVGGVSKLTEAELAKVSAQAKEAAAKLQALGQDVPPGIQKIADATKTATDQTKSWKDMLTSTAGAFGLAFSVGSLVAFGKSVFDSASKIHDLSEQMGVSTDAVQGFKFAAEQAGSSLDTVNTAITKMNANLDGGDKATVEALGKAGLGFQEIRSMKPEDAFLAITDAIQKIPDPMTQSEVALKLFGKSAGELLPAIKEGFRGAADGASKMSDDTIKSLEAAQDAWGKLADKVTIATGTMIAHAMGAANQITSSWSGFVKFVDDAIKGGGGSAVAFADAMDVATKAAEKHRDVNLSLPGPIHKTQEELDAAAAAAKRWADALSSAFKKWSGADVAEQAKILDITFRKMADSGQITEQQLRAMATEAAKLAEQGAVLSPRLWDIVMATGALDPPLVKGTAGITNLGTAVELQIPKLSAFNEAILEMNAKLGAADASLTAFTSIGIKLPALTLPKVPVGMFESLFGTPQQMGAYVSSSIMSAIQGGGNVFGAASGAVGQQLGSNIASKLSKSLTDEGSGLFSKALGGVLSSALPVVGSLIGPLASALWGKLFGSAGRDAVKDFAGSMGGFDALHLKLNELDADGEKLWIALTQGVGKNNPAQAKAAIDAITAALDAQKSKSSEAAAAAAAEAQAQVQAQQQALDAITERYAGTISKLESEYKSLNDSVSQEAEEAVMGVVETQQRERMKQIAAEKAAQEAMRDAEIAAKQMTFEQWVKDGQKTRDDLDGIFGKPLEIPYSFVPTNSPGGDGGGRTYTPPAGGGGAGAGAASGSLTIPVYIDGHEVGRAAARYIPGVLVGAGR